MLTALLVLAITLQTPDLPPEARVWFAKGQDLIGTDREYTQEQADYFEKVLELAPDYEPAHYNLALIYLRMEQLDGALIHAGKLVELLPADPRGYQLRAQVGLRRQGDPDQIEADLLKVVELVPEDHRAWSDLARLRYEGGRYQEALDAARIVQRHSSSPDTQLTIALCQHGLGRLEEAEESYRKFLALEPDDFTAHFNLGIILRQNGRDDEALVHWQAAERQQPDDPRVARELGELYLDRGQLDEARTRLQRADVGSPVNLSNLGVVARETGDLEGARGYFMEALKMDPENALLWGHLGDVQSELGRRAEALHSYQTALKYDPEDISSLLNLGSMLANLDEPEQARTLLARALEMQPDSGDAAFRLAVVQERLGQDSAAFDLYVKALGLGFDEARLHFRLAVLYSRRQQPEPALKHLEESFKRDAAFLVPIVREQLKAVRSDLDAIRYKPAFQELLERYSPGG